MSKEPANGPGDPPGNRAYRRKVACYGRMKWTHLMTLEGETLIGYVKGAWFHVYNSAGDAHLLTDITARGGSVSEIAAEDMAQAKDDAAHGKTVRYRRSC